MALDHFAGVWNDQKHQHDADNARQGVEIENHAPVHVFGDVTAEHRADDRAARHAEPVQAHGEAALVGREGLREEHHGHRHHGAAADPLQDAEKDQGVAAPGEAAKDGTDDEDRQTDE